MLHNGDICLTNSADSPSGKAVCVNEFALSQFHRFGAAAGYQWMHRVGVKAAGRLLDGVLHDAFPVAKEAAK